MWRGVVLVSLVGCGYNQGAFDAAGIGAHPPARVQLGCLDIGVGLHDRSSARAPTLRVGLGNGCDHRIRIDLASIRAEGRDGRGNRVALAPYPAEWMNARELGARWHARELITYAPIGDAPPVLREVCFDVGKVNTAHVVDHWLCLAMGGWQ